MTPDELAAIREKHEGGWPLSREAITYLLAYVDELKQTYLDGLDALRAEYDEEIREIERAARDEMAEMRYEHHQEMAEAGAELRGLERELANVEAAAERGGW